MRLPARACLLGWGGRLVSRIGAISNRYPSGIDKFFHFFNSKISGYVRDTYQTVSGMRAVSSIRYRYVGKVLYPRFVACASRQRPSCVPSSSPPGELLANGAPGELLYCALAPAPRVIWPRPTAPPQPLRSRTCCPAADRGPLTRLRLLTGSL
jgi:hypothetical protein